MSLALHILSALRDKLSHMRAHVLACTETNTAGKPLDDITAADRGTECLHVTFFRIETASLSGQSSLHVGTGRCSYVRSNRVHLDTVELIILQSIHKELGVNRVVTRRSSQIRVGIISDPRVYVDKAHSQQHVFQEG